MTNLIYTLIVDERGQHTAEFNDSQSLADDVVSRVSQFSSTEVTAAELAGDIDSGFTTIDLRARNPHIAVTVRSA
ncbi:hypothetical protein ACT17_15475 [Mycolicibacterium conceptionense]|uniref:Uncharacterized protein n=1 Tax=Mycolicibacterium conceptionense TaxID=451644 RepID=A0A0J8U9J8_9MYCO|nr:hypothetical protein [Mycolicibacterium conceptionense]KMV17667.1 hypothetical protein ACT17_15475 [Mycolicibacterium conceptionense]